VFSVPTPIARVPRVARVGVEIAPEKSGERNATREPWKKTPGAREERGRWPPMCGTSSLSVFVCVRESECECVSV
jgi:hypothetical protein